MNRKVFCSLLALLVVAAMLLSACGSKTEPAAVETSGTQTVPSAEASARELSLSDWSLSVTTWSSPNGATIHLNATPSQYEKGDTAEFVVRLEGEQVAAVPCEWKDNTYVAAVDLIGADGYCYYVTLSGGDGAFAEIPVNTPAEPLDESLINLAASLEAYCMLTLEESLLSDGNLVIHGGTATVQAPRITNNNENVACAQATLVLTLDGEELGSKALTMAPGEGERSYETSLADVSFSLPAEIGEDQQLALRLDAVLTNGQLLSAQGGAWYYLNGALTNAVG